MKSVSLKSLRKKWRCFCHLFLFTVTQFPHPTLLHIVLILDCGIFCFVRFVSAVLTWNSLFHKETSRYHHLSRFYSWFQMAKLAVCVSQHGRSQLTEIRWNSSILLSMWMHETEKWSQSSSCRTDKTSSYLVMVDVSAEIRNSNKTGWSLEPKDRHADHVVNNIWLLLPDCLTLLKVFCGSVFAYHGVHLHFYDSISQIDEHNFKNE